MLFHIIQNSIHTHTHTHAIVLVMVHYNTRITFERHNSKKLRRNLKNCTGLRGSGTRIYEKVRGITRKFSKRRGSWGITTRLEVRYTRISLTVWPPVICVCTHARGRKAYKYTINRFLQWLYSLLTVHIKEKNPVFFLLARFIYYLVSLWRIFKRVDFLVQLHIG